MAEKKLKKLKTSVESELDKMKDISDSINDKMSNFYLKNLGQQ